MAKKEKRIEMLRLIDKDLIKTAGWYFSIMINGEKREFRTEYDGTCLFELDTNSKWIEIKGDEFSLSPIRKKAYDKIYKEFFSLSHSKTFSIRINRMLKKEITERKIEKFLKEIRKFLES